MVRHRIEGFLFLLPLVLAVFWNEYLSFQLKSFNWNDVSKEENAVRILLVADPQLIGYQHESRLFGSIIRWDADRYLKTGFEMAKSIGSIDMVVFLGDLLDEGMEATDEEFSNTVSRFQSIFNQERLSTLYIPGDNDVGGEMGAVSSSLTDRFRKVFRMNLQDGSLDFLSIVEINMMDGKSFIHRFVDRNSTFDLLLSHVPVLHLLTSDKKLQRHRKPDLILSAHDHSSAITRGTFESSMKTVDLTDDFDAVSLIVGDKSEYVELTVPTCSYRMGTYSVGYGLLSIQHRIASTSLFDVKFSVLWLPCRFYHFAVYISALLVTGILFASYYCRRRLSFFRLSSLYRGDRFSLLSM